MSDIDPEATPIILAATKNLEDQLGWLTEDMADMDLTAPRDREYLRKYITGIRFALDTIERYDDTLITEALSTSKV